MKDEYKILIGAVVVILIVIVGAFALSGSNNPGPSASPTVVPVTATPTAVPGGNGGATPSANPTVAPTVAPTVTPSTEPASGVKQTEFGYWITYPPLGPENWSSPKPAPANVVYFDPTSATMDPDVIFHNNYDHRESIVHRTGDPSGTVNVILHMTTSDNVEWISPDAIDYVAYIMEGDNVTDLGGGNYRMVFGPGVSENEIRVHVEPAIHPGSLGVAPPGWVKVTITSAEGCSVGADKDFTINITNQPVSDNLCVTFAKANGHAYNSSSDPPCVTTSGIPFIEHNNGTVELLINLARSLNGEPVISGALDVPVSITYLQNESMGCQLGQPHFSDGSSTATLSVKVPRSFIMGNYHNEVYLEIQPGDYTIAPNGVFILTIN